MSIIKKCSDKFRQGACFLIRSALCLGCKGSWVQIPPRRPYKSITNSMRYARSRALQIHSNLCSILSFFSYRRLLPFGQNSDKAGPCDKLGLIRNFQALGQRAYRHPHPVSQVLIQKSTAEGQSNEGYRGNGTS